MYQLSDYLGFNVLDISTYPIISFYLNSPSLSKIPNNANFDQNPSIFTLNWWYWHRQDLIHPDTRSEYWPQVTDLLPAVLIAVIYTATRIIFNRLITPIAIKYMNLSATSLVNKQAHNKTMLQLTQQYIDKQQRIAILNKKHVPANIIKHTEHESSQLYSRTLQYMCSVQPYSTNSKQYNDTQLKQLINNSTLDAIRTVKLRKFREAAWLFFSYSILLIFGCCVSISKPYVWDLSLLWADWHTHTIPTDAYIYYLIEIAHYLHLLFAEFVGVKKKDFIQMTIHHIVTLLLLYFSYAMNFVRIGVLILVIHDASDVFLELAKLCNYIASNNNQSKQSATKLQDIFFVIFAIVFMITRLYIYPFYIYHAMLVRSMQPNAKLGMAPVYWIFAVLLGSLIVLHIIWGSIIIKMVVQFVSGGITGDERSDDEDWRDDNTQQKSINTNKLDKRSRASSTADEVLNDSSRAT